MEVAIAVHNDKIRTIIKELIYRSIVNMIKNDERGLLVSKDGLLITDKLNTIIDITVNNNIADLISYYNEHKGNELTGKITYMLNSVFSAIDLNAVTLNKFDGAISTVTKELTVSISSRMYNELLIYKEVYLPSMRRVSSRAKAMMNELQHIDVDDLFNIVYAEDSYLTEVMISRGYTQDVIGGITDMSTLRNIFLKPLNKVDVYSTIKNTEYADLGVLLDELDTSGELGDMVEHIDTMLKDEFITVADILKYISKTNIEDIKTLSVLIIFLKNYMKDGNAVLRNGIVSIYKSAIKRLTYLIGDYNNLKEKDVLVYKTIKTGDSYTSYIIKDNFSKLFKDNEDVHMSDIYGFGINTLYNSELNVNKLCTITNLLDNKNKFNGVYNKYINIITSTNRLNNVTEIRNIYSIVIREVNTNMYGNSNVDSKNDIMDVTMKIVNKLTLDTLLDPQETVKVIFRTISKDINNFNMFIEELDNAKKLIGDDVDMDTSIVYASTCILSKYFVSMLKVI